MKRKPRCIRKRTSEPTRPRARDLADRQQGSNSSKTARPAAQVASKPAAPNTGSGPDHATRRSRLTTPVV